MYAYLPFTYVIGTYMRYVSSIMYIVYLGLCLCCVWAFPCYILLFLNVIKLITDSVDFIILTLQTLNY